MWAEAEACFAAHRAALRAGGVDLDARFEPGAGVLCTYRAGVIHLALPELASPQGRLRATMLASLMGTSAEEVARLFAALLPRLVAHEIGHALRAEAGRLGDDVRVEEQAADRVATLLSEHAIDAADRRRARSLLAEVTGRLGGLPEAAALHRHAALAARTFGLSASPAATALAADRLQRDYHRDLGAYLRVTAAWALIDLTLDQQDDLHALRRDLLAA